jgi:hypothetical protein
MLLSPTDATSIIDQNARKSAELALPRGLIAIEGV